MTGPEAATTDAPDGFEGEAFVFCGLTVGEYESSSSSIFMNPFRPANMAGGARGR
jgi:hypothetical protein